MINTRIRRLSMAVAALTLTLLPQTAAAQIETSTITGTVRDASGGAIPGATIRVVNVKTNGGVDVVSDQQGTYRASALPPGAYRVETTLDGFDTAVRQVALERGQTAAVELTLIPARLTEGVVVTARRIEEAAQDVPIPLSVVNRNLVENAGAFNVNRLKELVPTLQFYSTNPRNSAVTIRGLGAPFGLTIPITCRWSRHASNAVGRDTRRGTRAIPRVRRP